MPLSPEVLSLLDTGAEMGRLGLNSRDPVDAVVFFDLPATAPTNRWSDLVGQDPDQKLSRPAGAKPDIVLMAIPNGKQQPVSFVPKVDLDASEMVVAYLEERIRLAVPEDINMPAKGALPRKRLMAILDQLEDDDRFERAIATAVKIVFAESAKQD